MRHTCVYIHIQSIPLMHHGLVTVCGHVTIGIVPGLPLAVAAVVNTLNRLQCVHEGTVVNTIIRRRDAILTTGIKIIILL